jgi:hypothetical protein
VFIFLLDGRLRRAPIERLAILEHVIADHRYSERRGYGLIGVDQSNFQYQRKTGDAAVPVRLRGAAQRRTPVRLRRMSIKLYRYFNDIRVRVFILNGAPNF